MSLEILNYSKKTNQKSVLNLGIVKDTKKLYRKNKFSIFLVNYIF